VRRYRRAWALTQRELAALIGRVSEDSISRYERLGTVPGQEAMVALELIFGTTLCDLFPGVGFAVVRMIRDNAIVLRDRILLRSDAASRRKRCLLDDLIIRSAKLLSSYD
jgi:transcriptional regulator with XRE-family HTH domain